jgi:hypothetical protein
MPCEFFRRVRVTGVARSYPCDRYRQPRRCIFNGAADT